MTSIRHSVNVASNVVSNVVSIGAVLVVAAATLSASGRKFYDDDPISREPETKDASKVQARDITLSYDLAENLLANPGDRRSIRALNVNTVDEVPDSSWFTNRILAHPLSIDEAVRGPMTGPGPAPGPVTVTRAKPSGVSAGFVLRDSAGVTWFVQFDAPGHAEAASGASMVANRIFHALGYWQSENHLAELRPEDVTIGAKAVTETPSGKIRQLDRDDLAKLLERAARQPNGAYRMLASREIPDFRGRFRYYGTRGDDPNDIVPHEHRRELRALQVFGAWTNLVDMKAKNTLDALATENGLTVLRHYLQDVGSTFGTGALGPREWDEGYELLFEGDAAWKRLVSFGFYRQPWQTTKYTEYSSIGRFEGDGFDPTKWKPRVPTAALRNARADDNFWAARRVMAFSADMIRAIVKAGQYSDPAAEQHLADVLVKRRDRIGRAYLTAINPIVNVALDRFGTVTFANAAVDAQVAQAPTGGYRARWFVFDNATGESTPLGAPTTASTGRMEGPAGLPTATGSFVRIDIETVDPTRSSWSVPVQVYFKRSAAGWALVGLERLP
ncbi:MAG: hypothetical protein A3H97_23815 [Acidobacteria bacterium RIFCSPLOWO2_02_FULL_65_29]|nr:MAG: hypothetical protein A3H97_23815 [Acidobacteria bacterium RIFCSPLOWO2_02_FULL_65_29]